MKLNLEYESYARLVWYHNKIKQKGLFCQLILSSDYPKTDKHQIIIDKLSFNAPIIKWLIKFPLSLEKN